LDFAKKRFATTGVQIIGNEGKIGEALKMVCSAYHFSKTWH
jgi:hypothetical protein